MLKQFNLFSFSQNIISLELFPRIQFPWNYFLEYFYRLLEILFLEYFNKNIISQNIISLELFPRIQLPIKKIAEENQAFTSIVIIVSILIIILLFSVQYFYTFKQQKIIQENVEQTQQYMAQIITDYNTIAQNSAGLLPAIHTNETFQKLNLQNKAFYIINQYYNLLQTFYKNISPSNNSIIKHSIIDISQLIQQLYQISQNVILLHQVNKIIGQVIPIYSGIAAQYSTYNNSGTTKIYEFIYPKSSSEKLQLVEHNVPNIFKFNGYYYLLLAENNQDDKVKKIDLDKLYQNLITPNTNDNIFEIQDLSNSKICSYPSQRYINAISSSVSQTETDPDNATNKINHEYDVDDITILDNDTSDFELKKYYINNDTNFSYGQNISLNNESENKVTVQQTRKNSVQYYSYNFDKVIPLHEHTDLVKNVMIFEDGKNTEEIDIQNKYLNNFIYTKDKTKISYPILSTSSSKNTISTNDILQKNSSQGINVNYNSPAFSVCWYAIIGYEFNNFLSQKQSYQTLFTKIFNKK